MRKAAAILLVLVGSAIGTGVIVSTGGSGSGSDASTDVTADQVADLAVDRAADTDADTSAPVITLTPSRTSGAVPLAVYFDTEGTTSVRTDKPVHELHYSWDFGPDAAGDTSSGGRYFTGFVAAHVFETAATHHVTLTVTDSTGASSTTSVDIGALSAPAGGWTTYCFSNDTDFTGCPDGSTHSTTAYWQGYSGDDVLDHVGTNRRLLMKRGGSFNYTTSASIGSGPMLIGAFGSGDDPIVKFTGTRANDWDYYGTQSVGDDVRFSDIEFQLLYNTTIGRIATGSGTSTWLRVNNVEGEIFVTSNSFIVDSHLSNSYGNPSYGNGASNAIIKTEFGPSQSHGIYGECLHKAIFAGNYFHDVYNNGRTGIRIAENTCAPSRVLVTGNHFDTIPAYEIQMEQTTNTAQLYQDRDVVIEKNLFTRGCGILISRDHGIENVTIRNNIFDMANTCPALDLSTSTWGADGQTGARGAHGIWFRSNLVYDHSTTYPAWVSTVHLSQTDAQDIAIENNIFTADGVGAVSGYIRPLNVVPEVLSQLTMSHNLYYYPDLSSGQLFSIVGVSDLTLSGWQAYNSLGLDEGSAVSSLTFVDPAGGDYTLNPMTPVKDQGKTVPVFEDFVGAGRLARSPWDIGPYEYAP